MAEQAAFANAGVDTAAEKLKTETMLGRIEQLLANSEPRFLHSVARRARLRREEKCRATPVGMT